MAEFADAIPTILEHEGGYVNDPDDPGGETNYGISKRAYPDVDIFSLTEEEAAELYERDYWRPLRLDEIHSQPIATYVLDCAVNHGNSRGVRICQRGANRLGESLDVDGNVGPLTLDAWNMLPADDLLREMVYEREDFYERIIQRNPVMEKYRRGWMRRARYPLEDAA